MFGWFRPLLWQSVRLGQFDDSAGAGDITAAQAGAGDITAAQAGAGDITRQEGNNIQLKTLWIINT